MRAKSKKQEPLAAIASRIDAHLKRMEADPKINVRTIDTGRGRRPATAQEVRDRMGTGLFYDAFAAYLGGGWVYIKYVAYQNGDSLRRADAERYLGMLDRGVNRRHYEVTR